MKGSSHSLLKGMLGKARSTGYAEFDQGDILYKIKQTKDSTFTVVARTTEKIVGAIVSTPGLDHDAIEVHEDFRGRGIGEMLYAIKTSLDGKRQHEWSQKYSRIRFLIRHGYYPIATAESARSEQTPLKKEDRKKLCDKIKEAKNASFIEDDAESLYYFELAPLRAFILSRKI